ncbi:MAG: DUF1003 domain-containing protein [Polyangiales bacterium]
MPTPAELLADVPLFALLDDQERAALAERVENKQLVKGSLVFNAGDPGDELFVVKSGKVEMFFRNDTGERIVLETAGPGEFFGEISLLDGGPRTASAIVLEDLDAVVVDREDLDELIRVKPAAALDLLAATGKRLRVNATLLRHTASRNVNVEVADTRSIALKVADWISAFSGSMEFLYIHIVLFAVWILLNVRPFSTMVHFANFDPFPFGLLTMCVSLEAIFLSVFVLLSQNRQAERDRVRNDVEYDVNLKAELEIAHLHEKVDHMHAEVLARLASIEKKNGKSS